MGKISADLGHMSSVKRLCSLTATMTTVLNRCVWHVTETLNTCALPHQYYAAIWWCCRTSWHWWCRRQAWCPLHHGSKKSWLCETVPAQQYPCNTTCTLYTHNHHHVTKKLSSKLLKFYFEQQVKIQLPEFIYSRPSTSPLNRISNPTFQRFLLKFGYFGMDTLYMLLFCHILTISIVKM